MAAEQTKNKPKDVIEPIPEEIVKFPLEDLTAIEPSIEVTEEKEITDKLNKKEIKNFEKEKIHESLAFWSPKTKLGKAVKLKQEKDIDKILECGKKILEPEIVDMLIEPESDLILIGQAKGKFGGGKRRAWRQTQKKTKEGNVLSFSSMAVIGDKNNHIGIGFGKAKETLPSREKALRNAKLNVIKIQRGFESSQLEKDFSDPHTVPFKVKGKAGGIRIILFPAPRGTGLVISDECKKILKLAGIKDVYSKTEGKTKTTFNLAKACIDALSKTTKLNLDSGVYKR